MIGMTMSPNQSAYESPPRRHPLFAATALAALIGIGIQLGVSFNNEAGLFSTGWERAGNVFAYFTVQSNLLVAVTSLMLFIQPNRPSLSFRVLRLTGLIAITVTFLVYHAVLSNLVELDGWAAMADQLIHTAAPLLALAAWIKLGPRGQVDVRVALLAMLPAVAWAVFTLIRGALIDFYPYPFVDVTEHGYPIVMLNIAAVSALFAGLGMAAVQADRRMGAR